MSSGCCTSSDRKWRSARMRSFLHRHSTLEIFLVIFFSFKKQLFWESQNRGYPSSPRVPHFKLRSFFLPLEEARLFSSPVSSQDAWKPSHKACPAHRSNYPRGDAFPASSSQAPGSPICSSTREKIFNKLEKAKNHKKKTGSFPNFNSFWRKTGSLFYCFGKMDRLVAVEKK